MCRSANRNRNLDQLAYEYREARKNGEMDVLRKILQQIAELMIEARKGTRKS